MGLAVIRDLRGVRAPAGPDEIAAFETDILAGFVLARAAAGLADATIRSDVGHLEQLRAWFGRPLWAGCSPSGRRVRSGAATFAIWPQPQHDREHSLASRTPRSQERQGSVLARLARMLARSGVSSGRSAAGEG